MPFEKGKSGNPAGRPAGSVNKTTRIVQDLLSKDARSITKKCIDLAKDGDLTAIRLIIERVCPPAKDTPIEFNTKKTKTVDGLLNCSSNVIGQMGKGQLTPIQAKLALDVLETHRKILETSDLEKRIEQLEKGNDD